ncbi:MAG: 7-cyano-7-deazaguanine synthase QueC [Acidaminococcaceae bacterium]|nr:7-cyano-7-deazaguanine synthase QueC [Acidaminococcaceae bacterium]
MKAIVLSSGGIDSTTCIAKAVEKCGAGNVVTVSIFYGQKHKKELECARKIAEYYQLAHYEFDLQQVLSYSNCSLLSASTEAISHKSYAEQLSESRDGIVSTYVPFRNGLMLSVCASLAMSLFPDENSEIYIGAHADDAAGNAYADCSPAFTQHMSDAIRIGTYEKVTVTAPFVHMHKADIVAEGIRLHTPYHLTWSCYEGAETPCGICGTCIDRAKAFAANNLKDPVS